MFYYFCPVGNRCPICKTEAESNAEAEFRVLLFRLFREEG